MATVSFVLQLDSFFAFFVFFLGIICLHNSFLKLLIQIILSVNYWNLIVDRWFLNPCILCRHPILATFLFPNFDLPPLPHPPPLAFFCFVSLANHAMLSY